MNIPITWQEKRKKEIKINSTFIKINERFFFIEHTMCHSHFFSQFSLVNNLNCISVSFLFSMPATLGFVYNIKYCLKTDENIQEFWDIIDRYMTKYLFIARDVWTYETILELLLPWILCAFRCPYISRT